MDGGSQRGLERFEMQVAKVFLMALAASALNVHAGTVVVSGGASMVQSASGEEKRLSSLRVDCASYNRTNVGFLCGFDDGQRTILQFEEQEGKPVHLFDADGNVIAGVRRVGSYYVLPQLYRTVFARVGNKEAAIIRDISASGSGYALGAKPSAPAAIAAPAMQGAAARNLPVQGDAVVAPSPIAALGGVGSKENRAETEKKAEQLAEEKAEEKASAPAPKPLPSWTLTAGRTIGQELQAWGAKAGWKVIWSMQKDWAVPASTVFTGDFKSAASDVIKNLASNGALVRAQFYDGNKTLVVVGPGVTPQ